MYRMTVDFGTELGGLSLKQCNLWLLSPEESVAGTSNEDNSY